MQPDGTLTGLGGIEPPPPPEAGGIVVAQLLTLLATFIGGPLALRLVGDAWPDALFDGIDDGIEEAI